MKNILVYLLFVHYLFGDVYTTLYREEGIEAVEEKLLANLEESSYWLDYFKDIDTDFGYYEKSINILVVEKERVSLKVYKRDNKKISLVSEDSAFLGEVSGPKLKEGDLKTPVGVYDITRKLVTVDQFYGHLAFVTSYPNLLDKLYKRDGYGIWIHGLPLSGDRPKYTQGCIAINNSSLLDLDENIDHKNSILITSETLTPEVTKEDLSLIMSSIYRWKRAWTFNDIESYLSFYDDEFKRFDGKGIQEFTQMKRSIFKRVEKKQINFSQFDIAPYPNVDNQKLYRVTFYQDYWAPNYQFKGYKELYVKLDSGEFKIVIER